MKTAASIVRTWFAERPEFGREWPTSEATKIARTVELGDALAWIEQTIVRAIGDVARGHGMNAAKDGDGITVYVDPVDMPTLDGFLTGYLRPQLGRAKADIQRAWARTCEWVEAHPEAGISADRLWSLADGPDEIREAA